MAASQETAVSELGARSWPQTHSRLRLEGTRSLAAIFQGHFGVPLADATRATALGWAVVVVRTWLAGWGQLELWALDVAARARRRRRRNSMEVWGR